ncbi:ATP-grasp domain-containing protein [Tenacibaculum larymnensis]|uniref:ATP-grasp domain-containing protein n=1 Tax=Tenacibaculum larymnensis TaxID=2878201 RepID=A0A9X4EST6_9FLAO|nr:ATP-grasp domain-containing protein [Tenacibaculum larymnensis]MDE1208100.1 ATP-grasp domain-containing protein [Tenacibaculum larymnensis]
MKKNILIYPCGTDNAIEIYESLKYSVHLNVYGGNSKNSIADLIYENDIIRIPNINENEFIEQLNEVIRKYDIKLIFPTHDDVVYFFSQNKNKINTQLVGAGTLINEVSRHKSKTYNFFKENDFVPKVYHDLSEIKSFPVFCKPDKGHGSIGAFKINTESELKDTFFSTNVITEFLPGAEYTVDCFSDKKNNLLYAFPRKRHLIRNGVSHINIEPEQGVIDKCFEIGKEINQKLNFKGLWFFQVKQDKNGNLKLLEVCPRMATTMAFDRYKGVNLPLLSVFAYLDMDVEINVIHENIELYRYSLTKARYRFEYENVYIDFDDTIIINGKVCIDAIAFIYQAKNQNKKVYLITKHEFDLKETLNKYHISSHLFDEIIHLNMDDLKYNFMTKPSSIFIDNFYKERKEVFENTQIPVFDVDGIKSLIKN